jgi:hypothetical protein
LIHFIEEQKRVEMSFGNPSTGAKLKALLASKTKENILKIIKNYNQYCQENGRPEDRLRGYSKAPYNTKEGLIEFLLERLADEEKAGILAKIEAPYLEELFHAAQEYIDGTVQREKLNTLTFTGNGIKLKFKGWQWENETEIELGPDKRLKSAFCSCRTGKIDGFCPHLATGFLALIKEHKIDLASFVFRIPNSSLQTIEDLKVDFNEFADVDKVNADIVLGDDYFISVRGNLVTLKWGGERAGKTTKDVTKEKKPLPVEQWVAKKVVDKILAPLRDHPSPRPIEKDTFGVVPIILENEKLTKKLLNKFKKKNEIEGTNLPSSEESLEKFLTRNL